MPEVSVLSTSLGDATCGVPWKTEEICGWVKLPMNYHILGSYHPAIPAKKIGRYQPVPAILTHDLWDVTMSPLNLGI